MRPSNTGQYGRAESRVALVSSVFFAAASGAFFGIGLVWVAVEFGLVAGIMALTAQSARRAYDRYQSRPRALAMVDRIRTASDGPS